MLESSNPFSDPEWKKAIMESEGRSESDSENYEYIGQEEFMPSDPNDNSSEMDFKSIISSAPSIPKTARNLILDASALAKNEKEQKAKEMTLALNDVFSQYNKTYGTSLSIDFGNLSNTLVNVADPETRKTLELYVSEVFKSIRPVLLLHLIQKLTLAMDYVLQPERMFDPNSFSSADLFLVIEKLMSYIDQLNELMKDVVIPDSDKVLQKIAEAKNDEALNSEESKKAVDDFMKLFMAEQNNKKD